MKHFISSQKISHDEAMVKYFGKNSCKQSIRNKSIRFDYKIWCQNIPSGYLQAFDPIPGRFIKGMNTLKTNLEKLHRLFLQLIEGYSENKKSLPYHFFLDNFFTTVPLLEELCKRGYHETGTIRSNRLDENCPLPSGDTMNKKERGSSSSISGKVGANEVKVIRWTVL